MKYFRLTLLHSFGSPDWNLQITNLQLEDSGIYECQVCFNNITLKWVKILIMFKELENI